MFTKFMALAWYEKPFALPAIVLMAALWVFASPFLLAAYCCQVGGKLFEADDGGSDFDMP